MLKDDVVISGIGALNPLSTNVQDFGQTLLENKGLLTATKRWKMDQKLGIKPISGQITYEHFDHVFYGMNRRLARSTDPVSKLGYMRSFEAIIDAGLHPLAQRGKNIGVFTSCGINEFEQITIHTVASQYADGYPVMGLSKTMSPNRISYFFDFNGPSVALDCSWTGAHLTLGLAAKSIRDGECEGALVVCSSLARFPETSFLLNHLGLVNKDGESRPFTRDGNGSVRGDSATAFFLQRGDAAKRCYARIVAADTQYVGTASRYNITLPSPRNIECYLSNLYRTNAIDPKRIAYLEADGSGNSLRDECELNAINAALVEEAGRSEPLLVGSVRGNVGHTDASSGFVAISKAIVAMETGTIPATINCTKPLENVDGLAEGKLKLTTSNTPLILKEDSVVAVNTLGLASMVGHTILRPNPHPPQSQQDPAQHLPRLITVSGRTEDGVRDVINKIQASPFDTNFYRLIQDAFSENIRGYSYRSFVICPPHEEEAAQVALLDKNSVWLVYSGMGSQWEGMGAALMAFPVFAETIERLHAILLPKGLDLKTVITETGPQALNNILKSFVGITACQIALTNVLTAIGIVPDGIIGHSVGELGCAYADGCLTEEQTILAAWARGVASNEATLIKGMMAALGMGYKEILPRLPPTIDVACHNSDSSCTLSGPMEDVQLFVKQLSDEGVFARAVNVSDIAYHSRYIRPAAPLLRKYLDEVITEPKRRSNRWITTSVPLDQREQEWAKYCSAEYQTMNLLSPVLFEEGLKDIPKNSVLIEVAPHGLLQAILKRALPEVTHISLTQRAHVSPVHHLLNAIGRIALAGAEPSVSKLYPDVEFPVPRGTASLSQLVTSLEDDSTFYDVFSELETTIDVATKHDIDSPNVVVNGTRLCVLSEELMMIWQKFLSRSGTPPSCSPVSFRSVHIDHWHELPCPSGAGLKALVMEGSGQAVAEEISKYESRTLLRCIVRMQTDDHEVPTPLPPVDLTRQDVISLTKEELYHDMAAMGLRYNPKSQKIKSIQMGETDWLINVERDATCESYLESVIQTYTVLEMEHSLNSSLPIRIQRFDLDPTKFLNQTDFTMRLNLATRILEGPGIFVSGVLMEAPVFPLSVQSALSTKFLPFIENDYKSLQDFLHLTVVSVLYSGIAELTLMQLPNGEKTSHLCAALVTAIHFTTGVQARVVTLGPKSVRPLAGAGIRGSVSLLVTGPDTIQEAVDALATGVAGTLLVWSNERIMSLEYGLDSKVTVLAEQRIDNDWITLLRLLETVDEADTTVIQLSPGDAIPDPATFLSTKNVVLVWQPTNEDAAEAAIKHLWRCASETRLVFVLDGAAPPFSLSDRLYADQLARGARVNVLAKGAVWGTFKVNFAPKTPPAALSISSADGVRFEFLGVNPLRLSSGTSLSGHVDYVGMLEDGNCESRVMGVGQWLSDDLRPQIDPLLRWLVPRGWSAADAATVPYVYAVVYLALKIKALARPCDSILVHEGASALGQAAIRVATQLGCSPIYTTVDNDAQRHLIAETFPQIELSHVIPRRKKGFFVHDLMKLTKGKGTRIVFSTLAGQEMKASWSCVRNWGRMIQLERKDMLEAGSIGMFEFLKSLTVIGFSGHDLFRATDRHRAMVWEDVNQGLRTGVVQPIIGANIISFDSRSPVVNKCTKTLLEANLNSEREPCNRHKCYLVWASSAEEALLAASRLSQLGARRIQIAVGSSPSSPNIRKRQRTLMRLEGTVVRVLQVQDWSASAATDVVKAAAAVGPIDTAVVVAKDESDLAVPALLNDAFSALGMDLNLVLLTENEEIATNLATLVERRNAKGRRTVCLAARLTEAVGRLIYLLSGTPGVAVLPSAISAVGKTVHHPGDCVPRTSEGLSSLSKAASRVIALGKLSPCGPIRVTKLTSRGHVGPKHRDITPLFTLPPMGVLDPVSKEQLSGLASTLNSQVFVVEFVPDAARSIKGIASAVVQAILAEQPHGPYNLLGWCLSNVLALEVQRQLEAVDKLGVLFLIHGDVGQVRQWAQQPDAVEFLEPLSQEGERMVTSLLHSLAEHESNTTDNFKWHVNIIRACSEDPSSLQFGDPNVTLKTMSELSLARPEFSRFVIENSASMHILGGDQRSSVYELCT